jgi:hypothetical protein
LGHPLSRTDQVLHALIAVVPFVLLGVLLVLA